jgi:hypothetical protein
MPIRISDGYQQTNAFDRWATAAHVGGMRNADDLRSIAPTRHGAYVCLRIGAEVRDAVATAGERALPPLMARLGLVDSHAGGAPPYALAFLRRIDATPAALADDGLLHADAVVHVAAPAPAPVASFVDELTRVVVAAGAAAPRVLAGVVRPPRYTGDAMHDFAYAHQVLPQPAALMPHAFLVPLRKTADWWAKDWMERHTYFLPRYGDDGRMRAQGHALAAAAGVPAFLRRTYQSPTLPAPDDGSYDFVSYFECDDAGVPVFAAVCAALRDVERNPEWRFVREGPTWHGRRVAGWSELFAAG